MSIILISTKYTVWNAVSSNRSYYSPELNTLDSTTDRNAAFTLKNKIAINGGFSGTETDLDQRDWQLNLTVQNGDSDNNDITDPISIVIDTNNIQGLNSYHVVIGNSTGDDGVMDRFVVTKGKADGIVAGQYTCGGM